MLFVALLQISLHFLFLILSQILIMSY